MFDGLTFLHYLHNVLLDHALSKIPIRISWSGAPVSTRAPKKQG